MSYNIKYDRVREFLNQMGYQYVVFTDHQGNEENLEGKDLDIDIVGVFGYIGKDVEEMARKTETEKPDNVHIRKFEFLLNARNEVNSRFLNGNPYMCYRDLSGDWKEFLRQNEFEVFYGIEKNRLKAQLEESEGFVKQAKRNLDSAIESRDSFQKKLDQLEEQRGKQLQ